MKRNRIIILTGVLMLVAVLTVAAETQDSQTTKSKGSHNMPMMKGDMGMMGSGMMGSGMMGPGMMGGGMMKKCMMMASQASLLSEGPLADLTYNSRGELLEPLSKKKATEIAQFYLDQLGNPRLKLGQIKKKDKVFEAAIVTIDNSLVNRLLIEKDTGRYYIAKG